MLEVEPLNYTHLPTKLMTRYIQDFLRLFGDFDLEKHELSLFYDQLLDKFAEYESIKEELSKEKFETVNSEKIKKQVIEEQKLLIKGIEVMKHLHPTHEIKTLMNEVNMLNTEYNSLLKF